MSVTQGTRPFPWKCGNCREKAVERETIAYDSPYEYDGKLYNLRVAELEVPRCKKCGQIVFDVAANRQITDTLRDEVGLLFPEQIRQNREALGLRQRELANLIGIAEATLSRWENGAQIQQRSLDKLMRLFFASADVRARLADANNLKTLGQTVSGQASRERAATAKKRASSGPGTLRRFARAAKKGRNEYSG